MSSERRVEVEDPGLVGVLIDREEIRPGSVSRNETEDPHLAIAVATRFVRSGLEKSVRLCAVLAGDRLHFQTCGDQLGEQVTAIDDAHESPSLGSQRMIATSGSVYSPMRAPITPIGSRSPRT